MDDHTPTEPGWYWLRLTDRWRVVEVSANPGNPEHPLLAWYTGCEEPDSVLLVGLWGPRVEPPTESG